MAVVTQSPRITSRKHSSMLFLSLVEVYCFQFSCCGILSPSDYSSSTWSVSSGLNIPLTCCRLLNSQVHAGVPAVQYSCSLAVFWWVGCTSAWEYLWLPGGWQAGHAIHPGRWQGWTVVSAIIHLLRDVCLNCWYSSNLAQPGHLLVLFYLCCYRYSAASQYWLLVFYLSDSGSWHSGKLLSL